MSKPVISFSHSACESFMTCPQKHYQTRIAKSVVESFGEAADWGKKVHAAIDRRLRLGAALPSNMTQYGDMVTKVEALAERLKLGVKSELALAVDAKLRPCGWKDWNVCWGRCALDVLLINEVSPIAVAVDWKTGKVKENDNQLALQAGFVFRHYPHVQEVRSMFGWLKHSQWSTATFARDKEDRIWKTYFPIVRKMTDAVLHGDWPANPSGLCKEYCPVATCKHNGMYRKDS